MQATTLLAMTNTNLYIVRRLCEQLANTEPAPVSGQRTYVRGGPPAGYYCLLLCSLLLSTMDSVGCFYAGRPIPSLRLQIYASDMSWAVPVVAVFVFCFTAGVGACVRHSRRRAAKDLEEA